MNPKKPAPAFPTGLAAHRKCSKCYERYHIYQFRIIDKKIDRRSQVCLSCEARAKEERLAKIRPS